MVILLRELPDQLHERPVARHVATRLRCASHHVQCVVAHDGHEDQVLVADVAPVAGTKLGQCGGFVVAVCDLARPGPLQDLVSDVRIHRTQRFLTAVPPECVLDRLVGDLPVALPDDHVDGCLAPHEL